MGRKKKRGFEWVAEDAEGEAIEPPERPNRSAEKRRRQRMEGLAKRLSALPRAERNKLGLSEEVLDALEAIARSGRGPDRRRALLRAKGLLAEEDAATVDALLSA